MVSEVRLKYLKFATNLAISFRSCQSNRELGNEVVNFTPSFVGKLTSSLREKFAPFGEIVSEFPYTLWLRQLGIEGLHEKRHEDKQKSFCYSLLQAWRQRVFFAYFISGIRNGRK